MYVLDLVQERWSLIVTDDDSLIPTPRDKMAGWCYKKKLEFSIRTSLSLCSGINFQQITAFFIKTKTVFTVEFSKLYDKVTFVTIKIKV